MPILLFGLAVVLVLFLIFWLGTSLPPSFVRRMGGWTVAALAGGAMIFAALMGRWGIVIAILVAGVSILSRRGWRMARTAERDGPQRTNVSKNMSRNEAAEVLGVDPSASRDEVEAAFRRLMQKVHPDHGGSDWMAARLTEARAVLVSEKD